VGFFYGHTRPPRARTSWPSAPRRKGEMRTRPIARAIIDVLQPPGDSGPAACRSWYHAACIATQLRRRGVTVRVDEAAREMVLGEHITLRLHSQEAVPSAQAGGHQGGLPGAPETLLVRAVDLASIPYHYCFGETQGPHSPARRHLARGAMLAAVPSAIRTGWRLLALLTPSPAEVLRVWRGPWPPLVSTPGCDCVSPWQSRGAEPG
jgi:hypothetical protein